MLDDFVVRAALAGVGTAIAAGLLGPFIVWRRMAYFGDAVAHSAILGVALALALSLPLAGGVLAVALAMAWGVWALGGRGTAPDTILGVFAHVTLAAGLVALALIPGARVDVEALLFGDVVVVGRADLALIWGGAALVGGVVLWRWSAMLTSVLSPDLAHAAGIDPRREELIQTLLLALVVGVAIKVVGALLITALLIVPAAAARHLARTPEAMAVWSVGIGAASALAGLRAALIWDTPAGPSIVCAAGAAFVLSWIAGRIAG